MTLIRHSTASLTMDVYASADTSRLKAAAEAAAEHIKRAISAKDCSIFVPHALTAGTQDYGNAYGARFYERRGLVEDAVLDSETFFLLFLA